MKTCSICGKEYVKRDEFKNKELPEFFPQHLLYRAACECETKERERLEREREERIKEEEKLAKEWREEAERTNRINRAKKYRDITVTDNMFKLSTFDNADMSPVFMKLAKKYTDKFVEKDGLPQGLRFTGDVGLGKTFASACIANELLDKDYAVLFIRLGLYLLKIKEAFDNKTDKNAAIVEKELLKLAGGCDLLIIDDFGTEGSSEFVREKVFNLIDERYRNLKPIIISTNLSIHDIKRQFGARVADRVDAMTATVALEGVSRRKANKKSLKELLA